MSRYYVGQRAYQTCGEWAEIVELLENSRCRVRFDSGFEKVCVRYMFAIGNVRNKETKNVRNKVGDRVLQSCGEYAEIVELLPNNRCIVKFDGGLVKDVLRSRFREGKISNSVNLPIEVGTKRMQKCGLEAEVVEILDDDKLMVRIDGHEKVISLIVFKQRNISPLKHNQEGDMVYQTKGGMAKIVKLFKNGRRCIIEFENGKQKECFTYEFKHGRVDGTKF